MPVDPVDNISEIYPALPYDDDRNKMAALIGAIVSNGDIVGYLPLKVVNNGDGTATLDTTGGGGGGGIDPVGLKNASAVLINPATEDTLAAIKAVTDQMNFIGPSLDVKNSFLEAIEESSSTAPGTRLKRYEELLSIVDSPKTFEVKDDMDTVYTKTDSTVRFLRVQVDKQVTISVTSVDGPSEATTIRAGEIFSLTTFEFTSFVLTIPFNNTDVRILAEGF